MHIIKIILENCTIPTRTTQIYLKTFQITLRQYMFGSDPGHTEIYESTLRRWQ